MDKTLDALQHAFPQFSPVLIEEIYRIKGERALAALSMLASDEPIAPTSPSTSCTATFFSCDASFSARSRTEEEGSKATCPEGSECEMCDPAMSSAVLQTKSASTQSGAPDVVLGEELFETVSCPGYYEQQRDEDVAAWSNWSESSSCALDELFRMPIEVGVSHR